MPYSIRYVKGHKNSKGVAAPYCVINKDRNAIVASAPTKDQAEAAMRARYANEPKKSKFIDV
jgi:hypothetical protein